MAILSGQMQLLQQHGLDKSVELLVLWRFACRLLIVKGGFYAVHEPTNRASTATI